MSAVWPWLLAGVSVTGFWLAGQERWRAVLGWAVCLGNEVLWTAYSVMSRQWGFLASVLIFTAVFVKNLRRALRRCRQ